MDRVTQELWKKSGIYCIVNTDNQKKYVGSSKNIYQRLQKHRAYLRKNMHENCKLQNSWNKHGEDKFQYYVLEFCPEKKLIEREQFFIDTIKPWYNITLEVQRLKMSDESRIKMSKSRKEGFEKGTVVLYQEKPIHQYSLEGQYIQSFKSIKEASERTGVTRSSINRFLEGKYMKGGNFLWSLTKEESLPAYNKAPKDNSYMFKPILVTDLQTGITTEYASISVFAKFLGKNQTSMRPARINNYPYLKRYMIRNKNAV
jgi:group I intron endonuclease